MKKNVVLGVTGGIACYKALDIVSKLKKKDIDVDVIMTKSAMEFVAPLSFQSLSQNPVITDMFQEPKVFEIAHISLAKKADILLIAPCTANVMAKLAHGIADDFLTTTALATRAQIIIAPAMNTNMLNHPITQENIKKLEDLGVIVLGTSSGRLACGDVGEGKLQEPEDIVNFVINKLDNLDKKEVKNKKNSDTNFDNPMDYEGLNVVVTAGPTSSPIDPVRLLTNRSSGKTGYAIAKNARDRGAKVTLITGTKTLEDPQGMDVIHILTNEEMYNAIDKIYDNTDMVIMTAAVADYKIKDYSKEKIKKSGDDLILTFTRDRDILKTLGEKKGNQILVGFAAESNNFIENAQSKLEKKNLDMIVLNDIGDSKVFGFDTTSISIITKNNKIDVNNVTKDEAAINVLNEAIKFIHK